MCAFHAGDAPQPATQADDAVLPPSSVRILVVDDHPGNLVALEAALARVDCQLVAAQSGHDALKCLVAHDFALILLDIHMPDMDGFETAGLIRARQRSRTTPIIFLTADDRDRALAVEGYRFGAVDFMYTPWDPDVLRAKVRVFVELFRDTVVLEQQTAELSQLTAEEMWDTNERLLLADAEAHKQADAHLALRSEAGAALTIRDEFISIAAHELRTPVTGIKASAQLALRRLQPTSLGHAEVERYLHNIVNGANHLVLLINDLMDVSRIRNGEHLIRVAPMDLAALVRSVGLRHMEASGTRNRLTLDVPVAPLLTTGDAVRLEQLLDNVLSNAVKYSPAGGEIRLSLLQAQGGTIVSVSDSGIGLPAGSEAHIFEPFGRAANATREALPGMGMGLHI